MDDRKNPIAIESPEKIEKRRRALVADCLTQLATACGQKIAPERVALYCRGLNDIGESQLKFAFNKALHHLGEFLPSIEQLHLWAAEWKPVDPIAETRRLLQRDDKPTDWQALGRTSGVRPEEIAQWLEAGKAAQRAYIDKLKGRAKPAGREPGDEDLG